MYLGVVRSSGVDAPALQMDVFNFSIPDSEYDEKKHIISKIQECARERTVCTIEYKQWYKSPIYISTRYIVTGVEKR